MATGRNDPCPCGSGKKYKRCCLASGKFEFEEKPKSVSVEEQIRLVNSAFEMGDIDRARRTLEPLLRRSKVPAKAWAAACRIEMAAKSFTAAAAYMKSALEQKPKDASYLYNYATALSLSGQNEEAVENFRRALAIQPDLWAAYNNLGHALRDLGRPDEAQECYLKAFNSGELNLASMSQILLNMHLFCQDEHEPLFDMHCVLGAKISELNPDVVPVRDDAGLRTKIRLAYVSPRFSREIVGYFFKPLFDKHDRTSFEIYLYCATARTDELTEYFSQHCDKFIEVGGMSDTDICQQIVDDEIDILVDLAGHAPENRMTALARKPAPIQISMLDYFDTTGVEAFDYFVTDKFSTPDDTRQKFTEELIFLEQPRLVYESPVYAPKVSVRDAGQVGLVFGSFNRHHKIVPHVVETWCGLLRAVPDSRLVLKSGHLLSPDVQDSFVRQFEKFHVDAARIEFRGASAHEEMLAEYGDIDIALDTFPYNGGLTTCEALWMGTPVITLRGERIISRQTAGMLQAVGLSDFIADDEEAFAEIGRYWSQHRQQLNTLREGLRGRMAASPLTNAKTYAADFESHLKQIWHQYLQSQEAGT